MSLNRTQIIVLVLTVLFLVASIVIIVLDVTVLKKKHQDHDVDLVVILYADNTGVFKQQLRLVQTHMSFATPLVISQLPKPAECTVHYLHVSDDRDFTSNTVLWHPDVQQYLVRNFHSTHAFLYLGNNVVPFRPVERSDLFTTNRRRVFNIHVGGFQAYGLDNLVSRELFPVMVTHAHEFGESLQQYKTFILQSDDVTTSEHVCVRHLISDQHQSLSETPNRHTAFLSLLVVGAQPLHQRIEQVLRTI